MFWHKFKSILSKCKGGSILSNGYQGLFSWEHSGRGREAGHSPPSRDEVKECVELYIHSPSRPSWRGA